MIPLLLSLALLAPPGVHYQGTVGTGATVVTVIIGDTSLNETMTAAQIEATTPQARYNTAEPWANNAHNSPFLNSIQATKVTMPAGGGSVIKYQQFAYYSLGASPFNSRAVIWANDGGLMDATNSGGSGNTTPGTRLGYSTITSVTVPDETTNAPAWITWTFTTPVTIAGGTVFWIGTWGEDSCISPSVTATPNLDWVYTAETWTTATTAASFPGAGGTGALWSIARKPFLVTYTQ
jgi:hypothetical protein